MRQTDYKTNIRIGIVFIVLVVVWMIANGYLFYFADCDLVKHFWTVVQMPGRCLK